MAYSPAVLDHFHNPRNVGAMEHPDAVGTMGQPGQGNYMVVHVLLSGDRVVEVRFQTYGCPGAVACGSMLTEMARGRTLAEARAITGDDLLRALGGLPPGKQHCGDLAAGALHDALAKISGTSGPER